MALVLSCAACASATFELVNAPEHLKGNPILLANCPAAQDASTGSGVPKVGEPVLRSTEVTKFPSTEGEPGRSSCPSATPTNTSANACASAPAIVTGPVATTQNKRHDHRTLIGSGVGSQ